MGQHGKFAAKAIFVVLCCTAAAGHAAMCNHGVYTEHRDADRITGIVGSALLFAMLIVALWLGGRGRLSSSWLTLAYGSCMTMYVMGFFSNLLVMPPSPWAWVTFPALAVLAWGGLRAASLGRWNAVLCWWLGSFPLCLCFSIWGTLR